ncbi:MAG: acyl-CoA dehydratase activase [Thermoplasmata archaeon]
MVRKNEREGYIIGLDLGSTAAKMAVFSSGRKRFVQLKECPAHKYRELYEEALDIASVQSIFCTGYHRNSVPSGGTITEIVAASTWAKKRYPNTEVIIDIGGQDIKIIDIPRNDFRLNDKCSAGTGAFLELFASRFGVEVSELGNLHKKSTSPASITSTCAVFALSEVISLSVQGVRIEDIVAGLHKALAKRIFSFVPERIKEMSKSRRNQDASAKLKKSSSVEKETGVICIGGPAMNTGLVSALKDVLGLEIKVPKNPKFVNAMGAALFFVDNI